MDLLVEIAPESELTETLPWWHSRLNLSVVAVAIAILCGALGWLVGNNRVIPDPTSTDIGFLQDMHSHHEQAVLIGLYFLELDGTSRPLRDLARETVFGRSVEVGRMIQLLRQFGATETNETDLTLAWMKTPTPTEQMPGLASESDLDKLLASSGVAADQLFVELMTSHHEGGIQISQYAAEHANVIEVRRFASAIVEGQTSEIDAMRGLIAG